MKKRRKGPEWVYQPAEKEYAKTFTEIGQELGVSDETARTIYLTAIEKLRAWAELGELGQEDEQPRFRPLPRGKVSGDPGWPSAKFERLVVSYQAPEYQDWDPGSTVVVSGPLADTEYPGRRFADRQKARAYWRARAGRIYEDINIPGRYAFRVKRGTIDTADFRRLPEPRGGEVLLAGDHYNTNPRT